MPPAQQSQVSPAHLPSPLHTVDQSQIPQQMAPPSMSQQVPAAQMPLQMHQAPHMQGGGPTMGGGGGMAEYMQHMQQAQGAAAHGSHRGVLAPVMVNPCPPASAMGLHSGQPAQPNVQMGQPTQPNVQMGLGYGMSAAQPIQSDPAMAQPPMSQPPMSQPPMAQPSMAQPPMSQPSIALAPEARGCAFSAYANASAYASAPAYAATAYANGPADPTAARLASSVQLALASAESAAQRCAQGMTDAAGY